MEFMGFRRPDGKVGIRNYVGIIPSVFCANRVAEVIAQQVEGCVALSHPVGCSQVGEDLEITARTLKAMGNHPNLGAVLIVGLGCERFKPEEFYQAVKISGKPVEVIVIQDEGDSLKTIEKGVRIAKKFITDLRAQPRVPCSLAEITLGVKCGGTDATSGIAANPAVGALSDLIVAAGGNVILSEITELIGAEHILAARAVNEDVAAKIKSTILRMEEHLKKIGTDERFKHRGALISTGNFDGGVSSVAEKALGGIYKAGTSKITNVIDYAVCPQDGEKGLFIMDSPGHDGEVVTAMVGGGAQIIAFTSGRGTPTGFPFVPVIKVTGNEPTAIKMWENIDFDASDVFTKGTSLAEKGVQLQDLLIKVANGQPVKAEILKHAELFCITRK